MAVAGAIKLLGIIHGMLKMKEPYRLMDRPPVRCTLENHKTIARLMRETIVRQRKEVMKWKVRKLHKGVPNSLQNLEPAFKTSAI